MPGGRQDGSVGVQRFTEIDRKVSALLRRSEAPVTADFFHKIVAQIDFQSSGKPRLR